MNAGIIGRSWRLTYRGEEGVEAGYGIITRHEPMPSKQQIWRFTRKLNKRIALVMKDIERQPCIKLGIIEPSAVELAILVALDEAVVRISRKRQWIQP